MQSMPYQANLLFNVLPENQSGFLLPEENDNTIL